MTRLVLRLNVPHPVGDDHESQVVLVKVRDVDPLVALVRVMSDAASTDHAVEVGGTLTLAGRPWVVRRIELHPRPRADLEVAP